MVRALFRKELWTRELVAWYLYDFANSFVYINATLYFSQWVVVDQGLTDFWYSLPFIIATVILIVTSSAIGALGDRRGVHGKIFLYATFFTLGSFALMFSAGKFLPAPFGTPTALVFFGLYQFGYLTSFVPYNAFIKFVSAASSYGKVSGIGLWFSQLGNISGLLLTLPIIQGTWTLFGTDRLSPLALALLAFCLFSLPALFVFGRRHFSPLAETSKRTAWWKIVWKHLLESRRIPGVFPFLLAYYFFSDAILTVSLFSAIYLQKVFEVPDTTKVIMSLLVLIGFALGAFGSGVFSDRLGHRTVLIHSLWMSGASIIGISLASRIVFLYPLFVLFGLTAGGVSASARSYLASLVPEGESGKFFGLYTFAERFASVIGPALWGLIIFGAASVAPLNYRMAAFAMGLIALLGIIPLRRQAGRLE